MKEMLQGLKITKECRDCLPTNECVEIESIVYPKSEGIARINYAEKKIEIEGGRIDEVCIYKRV